MNIVVQRNRRKALESSLAQHGLGVGRPRYEELGNGLLLCKGLRSFFEGYGGTGFYEVVQEEILTLAEPGSYVELWTESERCTIRVYQDEVYVAERESAGDALRLTA